MVRERGSCWMKIMMITACCLAGAVQMLWAGGVRCLLELAGNAAAKSWHVAAIAASTAAEGGCLQHSTTHLSIGNLTTCSCMQLQRGAQNKPGPHNSSEYRHLLCCCCLLLLLAGAAVISSLRLHITGWPCNCYDDQLMISTAPHLAAYCLTKAMHLAMTASLQGRHEDTLVLHAI
jgi:hypothetical protein